MTEKNQPEGKSLCGRLAGKVAVVTGASRGIGRAVALEFAGQGASLVVTYNREKSQAAEVVAQIAADGGKAVALCLEVRNRQNIREVFEASYKQFGRIDVLVNNAGINKRGVFDEITDDDWDLIMGVNLKGPFICCQEVFPYMIRQKQGRIINIASVAGQYHGPKTVHYAVSKAGLISLTKVLARYGAPHNILVNAVAPGIILTDQTRDELDSPAGQAVIGMTLLKRPGQLQDVAGTCVLLAADEQSYITGQAISVSGGAILG